MKPIKILELKTTDWMKGLSVQSGFSLGGLFRRAKSFDPYEEMCYFKPSLAPVQVDGETITTKVNAMVSKSNGVDGYVFAIGTRTGGAGNKCLYRIKLDDATVVDYSSQIDQHDGASTIPHQGITYWNGRLIYEANGVIRSNVITPASASDTNLLSTSNTGLTGADVIFAVGSDGYLYYTANQGHSIGKIIKADGTAGNINNAFTFTDTNLVPKDITSDGFYTIFLADNNYQRSLLVKVTCKIFFWDTISSKAEVIYDIPDSYVISAKYVNGRVLILGASGLWICNSATPPKLIMPLSSNKLPTLASQVDVKGNILYWASPSLGGEIYAYGSDIGKDILFNPYTSNQSNNLNTCLVSSGDYFVCGVDEGTNTPKVFILNSGTTRGSSTIQTTTIPLVQPYSLSHIKIVLKKPLATGEEVIAQLLNGNGGLITDTIIKSNTINGDKQELLFEPKPTDATVKSFEEFYLSISSNGPIVQRATVYGIPIDDFSQNL